MSSIREELEREREAYCVDPADCDRCRFATGGLCLFHRMREEQKTLIERARDAGDDRFGMDSRG